MQVHVNEIKLEGDDRFSKQFNLCSEYYIKAEDPKLSEEERKKYRQLWFEERQRLELGIY
jgi:hypothetical protein